METQIERKPSVKTLKPFLIGAIAGSTAVCITNPFDVAKTRLNLQGELLKSGTYTRQINGISDTLIKSIQKDGVRSLYRGLLASMCFQTTMNGFRLGTYENLKKLIYQQYPLCTQYQVTVNVICSTATGFVGAFFGSPFNMIKTRMQMESSFLPEGNRYKYKGLFDAIRTIYRAERWKGLFNGATLWAWRTGMASTVQLPSFDWSKNIIENQYGITGIYGIMLASSFAAFCTCFAICPLDNLSTRYFGQPHKDGKGTLYPNAIAGALKIIKIEGFFGLYKGFSALCIRIAPQSFFLLLFFSHLNEKFKDY